MLWTRVSSQSQGTSTELGWNRSICCSHINWYSVGGASLREDLGVPRCRSCCSCVVVAVTCLLSRSRWVHGRAPNRPEAANPRPTLELYCVLVHGNGLHFFVGDETTASGSSMTAECVLRSLSYVFEHWKRHHTDKPFPARLNTQTDNTVKEAKNSIFGRLLITLVSASAFQECTSSHLQVGHTHEDVG